MPQQKIEAGRIASNAVTVGIIADNAVTASKLVDNVVTASKLVDNVVTSNKLSSNLKLSLTQVFETVNVYTTAVGGNVNIDLQNNVVYFFSSNTTANVTFNFRANTQNTLDSVLNIGQTVTSAILLKQGAIHYRANVYIDGALQSPWWAGNSATSFDTSQQESIDILSFNILKTGANAFTVLAANTNFQRALNQNP